MHWRRRATQTHRIIDRIETCKSVAPFPIICGESEQNTPRHISPTSPISDLSQPQQLTADFKLAELSQLDWVPRNVPREWFSTHEFPRQLFQLRQRWRTTLLCIKTHSTPLHHAVAKILATTVTLSKGFKAPPRHHSPQHHRARIVANWTWNHGLTDTRCAQERAMASPSPEPGFNAKLRWAPGNAHSFLGSRSWQDDGLAFSNLSATGATRPV